MVKTSYTSYSGDKIEENVAYSAVKRIILAVRSELYVHYRTRFWCRQNCTTIYHKTPSSPTGILAVAGGSDILVNEILRRNRETSSLSPTEGLR